MPLRFRGSVVALVIAGAISYGTAQRQSKPPTEERKRPADLTAPVETADAVAALCAQLTNGKAQTACFPDLKTAFTIESLIATVPDPQRTNLGLQFDRSMEALVWAVGDVGYTLQSYWLPWNAEFGKTEIEAARSKAPAAETESGSTGITQPGFLLFRGSRPKQFFVVWLVGESPTYGMETEALLSAIENIQQYDSHAGTIRIVGPSFSGSFMSLADTLNGDKTGAKFRVMTGMATSLDAETEFKNRTQKKVEFGATVENSSLAFCGAIDYLRRQWPAKEETAILAEDQTVYGQQTQSIPCLQHDVSGTEAWLLVRFPREIGQLRNSYEKEATSATSSSNGTSSTSPSLTFTLKSATPGEGNLPTFSKEQSPLSQEAVLLDLANALQREHVRYAVIIATDVLDQIFLVRFLHHACPGVRLIVLDGDLLFVRAELSNSLQGVLSVSTYPLFLRNQHWTSQELKGELPRRVPFASKSAEGVYNATRAILWDPQKPGGGEVMLDYRDPSDSASRRPPLWLTVLGRTGYWPVALIPDKSIRPGGKPIASSLIDAPGNSDRLGEKLHPETPSHAWELVVIAISLFSCLQCLYVFLVHLRQLRGGRWTWKPLSLVAAGLYAAAWTYPRTANQRSNALFIFTLLTAGSAAAILVGSGLPYVISKAENTNSPAFWFFVVPAFCFVASFGTALYLSFLPGSSKKIAVGWLIAIAFLVLWGEVLHWLNFSDMRVFFFAYRSAHPDSGVSPGLPLLLLLSIWFMWAFVQLWREAGRIPPEVPALQGPRLYATKLNEWLPRLFPSWGVPLVIVVTLLAVLRLHSVENRWYDYLIWLALLVAYFLMFSAWVQLLFAWQRLRRFLEALERHVMRDAFTKLPKELAALPLLHRGRQRPFLMTTARCCDTLAALGHNNAMTDAGALAADYEDRRVAIRTRVTGLLNLRSKEKETLLYKARHIAGIKNQLERSILHTANMLIDRARTQFWRSGKSDSLDAEADSGKPHAGEALTEAEKGRILAEEFIALRFTMYILYALDQMKKLMWFVVLGFVAAMIALGVYPFESRRLIDFSSIVIFAVLAAGTATVLAQMDRDAILSRLTATNPNEISRNFFIHLARFGALPILTLLSTEFPSIRNFLFSWIQPALQALSTSG